VERDGWAPYRSFKNATHQSCYAHLLRRCHDILETAQRGAARFPRQVKDLLQNGLELRDRRDAGLLSPHGLAVAIGRLEARRDRLLDWQPSVAENARLVKHLRNERDALFTYLKAPDVQATNWRAEHAVRYMVPLRKVFGGNRTWSGAHTQQILASVRRTSVQQGCDPAELLVWASRSPVPVVAEWLCSDQQPPPELPLPPAPR
jgi:transposase